MGTNCFWQKASTVQLQVCENVLSGFDIGFDKRIPLAVEQELRSFVNWVERNFTVPITLWVDFEYKHYLLDRNGKRVGYLFYWTDFSDYPEFHKSDDIPQIRLPVRTEHSSIEEILRSLIQAITDYYAWICNENCEEYVQNDEDIENILRMYLQSRQ